MKNAIFYIISFILGFFGGWWVRGVIYRRLEDSFKDELVLTVVAVVFLLTSLVSLVEPSLEVPIPLYGLMGAIVGYFFKKSNEEKDSKKN